MRRCTTATPSRASAVRLRSAIFMYGPSLADRPGFNEPLVLRRAGGGVAQHRARHAARAATAAAELGPGDPDHLDACGLQRVVRDDVALVGDDQPWCDGEGVVAVVPLLAL